jgi:hypothetical protein
MQDLDGTAPPVATRRVVGVVTSPALHAHEPADDPGFGEPSVIVEGGDGLSRAESSTLPVESPGRTVVIGAFVAAAAIASGDIGIGMAASVAVGVVLAQRYFDRHVTFTFGEGFVGYRGDPAWPQGVQEDDDVHWSWKPSR